MKRMFPYPVNPPTHGAEKRIDLAIAALVASDFGGPISKVCFGHPAMESATMPKAAVNKKSKPLAAKDKIRPAWERLVTTPTSDMVGAEDGYEPQFCSLIPP